MRELTYFVATSLDGRIAAPDGSADFFAQDPAYLTELAAEWGDAFPTAFHEASGSEPPRTRFDAVVMGRATFEPALAAGIGSPYAHLDTYVCSTTLAPLDHPEIQVVGTDPVALVRRLKAADGTGIWLCGGGRLAATLVDEIDRLVIKLNPVSTGKGRPLFDGPVDVRRWRRVSSRVFDAGVVLLEHVRADVRGEAPTA